jgi:hypothetical protein
MVAQLQSYPDVCGPHRVCMVVIAMIGALLERDLDRLGMAQAGRLTRLTESRAAVSFAISFSVLPPSIA